MKALHFDTGRDWRGGQAQVLLLLEGLAALGVDSALAAPPGPLLERARRAGFRAIEWSSRGDWDVWAAGRARRAIAAERPDVVHLHSARAHALGVPAARRERVPAIVVSRRVVVAPGRDPWSRWKYGQPVDRYLCVSEAARAAVVAAGVARERTEVVPSGIPLARWREQARAGDDLRTALRTELRLDPGVPILGTVASMTREKNHAMLLRVAGRLRELQPAAHLVWVGDGPLRDDLLRERDRLGLQERVHLLGRRDDVAPLTRQFTLALVASRHEGFCGAAVEAMALGIPVIATAVGGIPEVVAPEAGALVPDDDDAAMALRVRALLGDDAERARRAAAAVAVADRFDASRTASSTFQAYRGILAGRNFPGGKGVVSLGLTPETSKKSSNMPKTLEALSLTLQGSRISLRQMPLLVRT
jgi:L-malate glycosyltransferase